MALIWKLLALHTHQSSGAESKENEAPGMFDRTDVTVFSGIDCFNRHPAQFLPIHDAAHNHLHFKLKPVEFTGDERIHQFG